MATLSQKAIDMIRKFKEDMADILLQLMKSTEGDDYRRVSKVHTALYDLYNSSLKLRSIREEELLGKINDLICEKQKYCSVCHEKRAVKAGMCEQCYKKWMRKAFAGHIVKEAELEKHTISFECTGNAPRNLVSFLKYLEIQGGVGHSMGWTVDDDKGKSYGFDGDGADRISNIRLDGEPVDEEE